jgi:ribosomal protein S18 acetylase RimI-like enzyme
MKLTRLGPEDGPEILNDLPSFWDGRDLRALHHPFWLRQCASDALIIRDENALVGYLLGVVTAQHLAYVHLVAIRQTHRERGLGSRLYNDFLDAARERGAQRAEAITTPSNGRSIAFHQRLGFTADEIPDYAGPGQTRVLFQRRIG